VVRPRWLSGDDVEAELLKRCLVLGVEGLRPATGYPVGDWTHRGVDGDARWAGGIVGFDVEVSETVVDESSERGIELAAVAAVSDAEVGGEFVDAMDAPLVVAVMVNVVEKASGGRAKLGQPPAAPVVMAQWDVEFVVVRVGGESDCEVLVLHGLLLWFGSLG